MRVYVHVYAHVLSAPLTHVRSGLVSAIIGLDFQCAPASLLLGKYDIGGIALRHVLERHNECVRYRVGYLLEC